MRLHGKVVQGLGIGKKLGYPTANLDCGGTACPAPGVYAAKATFDGATRDAAVVIGARREGDKPLVEIYLLDFEGDLYGKELAVEVLDKVSDIERIDDEHALSKKIEDDLRKVRAYFA